MPDDDPIPTAVRAFVRERLSDAYLLDALVYLARARRGTSVQEAARRLVLTAPHAERVLHELVARGLAEASDGAYLLRPAMDADRACVEELSRLYDTYRLRLVRIIYAPREMG